MKMKKEKVIIPKLPHYLTILHIMNGSHRVYMHYWYTQKIIQIRDLAHQKINRSKFPAKINLIKIRFLIRSLFFGTIKIIRRGLRI